MLLLKCCFTSTETVGLLGTGTQDVHLDLHTAPELWRVTNQDNPFYEAAAQHKSLNGRTNRSFLTQVTDSDNSFCRAKLGTCDYIYLVQVFLWGCNSTEMTN